MRRGRWVGRQGGSSVRVLRSRLRSLRRRLADMLVGPVALLLLMAECSIEHLRRERLQQGRKGTRNVNMTVTHHRPTHRSSGSNRTVHSSTSTPGITNAEQRHGELNRPSGRGYTGVDGKKASRLIRKCQAVEAQQPLVCPAEYEERGNLHQRTKPLVMAHFGHGGGTFLCNQAIANCERTTSLRLACNCEGDLPLFPQIRRNCTNRAAEIKQAGLTFIGVERPFEEGEFCPELFDYVLLIRDPLSRVDSLLATFGGQGIVNVSDVANRLRSGDKALWPFSTWHRSATSSSSMGEGMTQFDNYMVRFLAASSAVASAPLNTIGKQHLAMAITTLEQFSLISELGSAHASADFGRAPVGWRHWKGRDDAAEERDYHHAHAPKNTWSAALSSEMAEHRTFFADLNKWDVKLFNHARSLAQRRRTVALQAQMRKALMRVGVKAKPRQPSFTRQARLAES